MLQKAARLLLHYDPTNCDTKQEELTSNVKYCQGHVMLQIEKMIPEEVENQLQNP